MRIAQLLSAQAIMPPEGDRGRYLMVQMLIEGLEKKGVEIILYASPKSKFSGELRSLPIVSTEGMWPSQRRRYADRRTLSLTEIAFLTSQEFDLIHVHLDFPHFFFLPMARCPVLMTQHWPVGKPELFLLEKLPRPNFWITPISLSQKKAVGGDKILNYTDVVYNGIDLDKFSFMADPKGGLVYLSRMVPEKGALISIQVAKKLKARLDLAGRRKKISEKDVAYWRSIEKEIDNKYIFYHGELPHKKVPNFLGQAKALLFPIDWEEPFGMVMIEAMACGTPVIAFRRGSVPEVVKDGVTGFVVDTVAEMAAAVKKIDQIDRRACRKHVEENFTLEKMVDGYFKRYKDLIAQ